MVSTPPLLTLTIDLDAIAANWADLAARAAPAIAGAVVKADAYGLGLGPVARRLALAGCDRFFVATLDEGIALRGHVPQARIFVLSGPVDGSAGDFHAQGLTPVLNSLPQIALWRTHAQALGSVLDAALHIDTGMTRLGLDHREVAALAEGPALLTGLNLVLGITHLATADDPSHPLNHSQPRLFAESMARLPSMPRSIAASSGIFLGPGYHLDLVRPGAALYGVNPVGGQPNPMRQTVGLRAKILQVRDVDTPLTVGYGATHRVSPPARLATVGIGYADGYLRSLGNRGWASIGGCKVPVVGRISMDLASFDISALAPGSVRAGDDIDLIGADVTVDDVARDAGTIGYEILTSLSRRAHRQYLGRQYLGRHYLGGMN